MPSQEIPRQEWQDFAEAFSRQHEGWLVTIERSQFEVPLGGSNEALDVLTLAREQPLRALTLNRADDAHEEFRIETGTEPAPNVYTVAEPATLVFETDERGAHAGLQIGSINREGIYLRFRAAARPTELDGIP